MRTRALLAALTALALTAGSRPDGNRLTYLDDNNPYHVGLDFPKLTTPQWVGEDGVDAVVVLAIDDMRDPAGYESFLRPILDRLKAIDGRAPLSIMTCSVKPDDPRLQSWLKEGLSLEVHTLAHPCPLLQNSDLAAAKGTVDGCIDLLHQVPGNHPVAFRMPCCDSQNTISPRFFSEIFNRTTPAGHFLTIDSSVFQLFTPADPDLPRSLVQDPDGGERFRKYLPFPSFVNTIEDYPYPYVIGGLCWEFPCMVPSDWEAFNLQKANNPRTVDDLKAALDAVVLKKGVFNLVFHPHGWIKSEQVVELIDYAVRTHGKKVKFLNFREAQERIDKNLLTEEPLRRNNGIENGVRLLDLNADGFMDVVIGSQDEGLTRLWNPKTQHWDDSEFPNRMVVGRSTLDVGLLSFRFKFTQEETGSRFGCFGDGSSIFLLGPEEGIGDNAQSLIFDNHQWSRIKNDGFLPSTKGLEIAGISLTEVISAAGHPLRMRDIDGDGTSELLIAGIVPEPKKFEFKAIFRWSLLEKRWTGLPFRLPEGATFVNALGQDAGLRFVDLDEDGYDDVIFSNDALYGIYLFDTMKTGWTRKVMFGKAGEPGALPKIVRGGTDNGFWVHSRHLWWQNEDTAKLPDLVDRRAFDELLRDVPPHGAGPAKVEDAKVPDVVPRVAVDGFFKEDATRRNAAEAARKAIRVRPGFRVELAASEPLVLDPIAFDWGADGKLWVVEMGDYPLGVDGKGKPGGQVRILEDTDKDGRYDKVSVFLDGLGFPSGVMPWRGGVLIACAPDIHYAEDRDGDGKADVREVLFTGFTEGNQQHRINGFELGLDGWVYGANGDSGGQVRSLKTGKTVDIRGRDFRFKPDTGAFEAELGPTQYGRHRDDWGRWFGNNNPTWAWHVVLSDADMRRNTQFAPPDPRKYLEPDTRLYPVSRTAPRFNDPGAANRVTSANSATPYRDDLFGPHFETSLFVSEPVHNLVHRMVLEPDGPSLVGRRAPGELDREFLGSSDPWFRPTMLKTGPDGALWVADMDRAVIEHPEWIPDDIEKTLDLRAGSDVGRIFRVLPVDKAPRPFTRLDTLDTAGLVAALDSPNGWRRDTAHRLLLHKNDPAAVEPLRRLALSTKNPKARVQALWVLENLGALTPEPVLAALEDPHPQVRRNAVRVSDRLAQGDPALYQAVLKRSADPDASVRLELILVFGNWGGTFNGIVLAEIVRRDVSDPWFKAALLSSAPKYVDWLLLTLLEGPGALPDDLTRSLFALAGARRRKDGALGLIQAIGMSAGPEKRFTARQFTAMSGLLDAADRPANPLNRADVPGETLATALTHLPTLFSAARDTAADAKASEGDRIAALSLVGRDPQRRDADHSLLSGLMKPQVPVGVQLAALAALSRGHDPKLPETLLAGWKGHSPPVRAAVLDTLLSRADWTGSLLSSLEDTCTPPGEIDPAHRRQLVAHADPRLRERAAAVFGGDGGSRREVIETYRDASRQPGDANAGAAVFKRVCAACHTLGGAGNDLGPDLAALDDRSPEALLIAILDPSRAFEAKYGDYTVHLADGRVRTGMIASESATAVTLRRQQGEQDVILRADIEAMTATGKSLMPEGLEKDVSPRDLADLIAYVNAAPSTSPPKTLAGNRPVVVEPARDGTLTLPASAAEVHGDSLTFETTYGNLGFWVADNDRASWRFTASRAGRYAVWVDMACETAKAGQWLLVRSGGESIVAKVEPTGTWDDYRRVKLGELVLPAGPGRLTVQPENKLHGPLFDLRTIELRPVAAP